jgi:hypothetical protein
MAGNPRAYESVDVEEKPGNDEAGAKIAGLNIDWS